MISGLRRVVNVTGTVWLLGIAAVIAIGCGGVSPFLATQFYENTNGPFIQSLGQAQVDENPTDSTVLESVADLPTAERTIAVTVENQSLQFVNFSMTFVVTAGAGGFVPDDIVPEYLSAGYVERNRNDEIECRSLNDLAGTRLLTMRFGVNLGLAGRLEPATGDDPSNRVSFSLPLTRRPDTSRLDIPVPMLIVFGDDPDFSCIGSDPCTQLGFIYVTEDDVRVGKAAEASRIQGTVCNTNFGSAPEWRLDRTLQDSLVQPFQYAAGGTIVVTVLDRATDATTNDRNQVVWLVTNAAGTTIQSPDL